MPRGAGVSLLLLLAMPVHAGTSEPAEPGLERSFWVSLTLTACTKGYWSQDPAAPDAVAPTDDGVANAARLLRDHYGANRLYLLYHRQCAQEDSRRLFLQWADAAGETVEIVPTFLPMDYSAGLGSGAAVFAADELTEWSRWASETLRAPAVALYDVYPGRPWDWAVAALHQGSGLPVGQVGVQPLETPRTGLDFVVVDTWGGISAYRDNADWDRLGRGRLVEWVTFPRPGVRAAFDLICVAWDYDYSADGGTAPPYDDGRDDPLPLGRNRAAAAAIRSSATPESFAGFSSDLLILQSHTIVHGEDLYADLKAGRRYEGIFSGPLEEIAGIYRARYAPSEADVPEGDVLFEEPFEDTDWESRGWYDGPKMEITADESAANGGHSWRTGRGPASTGTPTSSTSSPQRTPSTSDRPTRTSDLPPC